MRRLADGAHASVSRPPVGVEVASLLHPRVATVEDADAEALLDLAYGQEDSAPPHPVFTRLRAMGLADDHLPADDAVVIRKLQETGADYAWQVPATARNAHLLDLLRRINSQRKVTFQLFGQTTVLPETGLARCLELTRRLGKRARVLLVGDDDMLSPVLAALGHDVTVLEIDPRLVAMLTRVAHAEGLRISFSCQDVRDPVPASWNAAFDAVMTDPMTFEPCLLAFLSRACSALKPRGLVLCALHASGGPLFDSVRARLPLRHVDTLRGFSAYHDEGFQESWYHSDLVVLRRVSGAPPFKGSERIPFDELIQGAHGSHWHGWRWVLGSPFRKGTPEGVKSALETWRMAMKLGQAPIVSSSDGRWDTFHVPLEPIGHVTASFDRRRSAVCATQYPFVSERDLLLVDALCAAVPPAAAGVMRAEASPLRKG